MPDQKFSKVVLIFSFMEVLTKPPVLYYLEKFTQQIIKTMLQNKNRKVNQNKFERLMPCFRSCPVNVVLSLNLRSSILKSKVTEKCFFFKLYNYNVCAKEIYFGDSLSPNSLLAKVL